MRCFTLALAQLLVATVALGDMGLPLGIPPGPEDPVLARVAPEECLFYMSWAGIASPDPKSEPDRTVAGRAGDTELPRADRPLHLPGRREVAWQERQNTEEAKVNAARFWKGFRTAANVSGAVFLAKMKIRDKPKAKDADKETADAEEDSAEAERPKKRVEKEYVDIEAGVVLALGKDAAWAKTEMQKFVEEARQARKEEKAETDKKDAVEFQEVQIDGQTWYRLKIHPDGRCLLGVFTATTSSPPRATTALRRSWRRRRKTRPRGSRPSRSRCRIERPRRSST